MIGFETAHHSRLITGLRSGAELLDNCTDGLFLSQLAMTFLLVLVVALQVMADVLEDSPGLLSLYTTRVAGRGPWTSRS